MIVYETEACTPKIIMVHEQTLDNFSFALLNLMIHILTLYRPGLSEECAGAAWCNSILSEMS